MIFHYQKKYIIILVMFTVFFGAKATIFIPVAHGELIDKITILEIKQEKMINKEKSQHVTEELAFLQTITQNIQEFQTSKIVLLKRKLKAINHILWIVEDLIRAYEKNRNFDKHFVLLARLVYFVNDLRAATKREICLLSHSLLIEEKEYKQYR